MVLSDESAIVVRDKFACAYVRFLFSEFNDEDVMARAILLSCYSVLRGVLRDAFGVPPDELINLENQVRRVFVSASEINLPDGLFQREAGISVAIRDDENKVFDLLIKNGVIRREEKS